MKRFRRVCVCEGNLTARGKIPFQKRLLAWAIACGVLDSAGLLRTRRTHTWCIFFSSKDSVITGATKHVDSWETEAENRHWLASKLNGLPAKVNLPRRGPLAPSRGTPTRRKTQGRSKEAF